MAKDCDGIVHQFCANNLGHGCNVGPLKGLFNAPYFEFMHNLCMAHVLPNP